MQILTPGTNIFTVYAQATNGNLSVTDRVAVVYAVSNSLTVVTNGKGIISPNYNGQYLRIGANYAMSASAIGGYMFTNWTGMTNGTLVLSTNKPTVQFAMLPNLVMQANFVDTNKPFISITNVTSGMLWSNAAFTVMGRATDNVAVASVYFSLNNAGWSNAITANNWANWQTNVTLVPGTNILAAYAEDTSGNISATDRLSLVYVVTNQLLIQASGLGSLSPNYSNAWLRIGQNYTMTASPASGFMFTNWVVSTNYVGGVTTNKPTLQFTMATNLTLQVNFTETARPTLTVLSPASGTHESSSTATVTGAAKDIWGIATVGVSVKWRAVDECDHDEQLYELERHSTVERRQQHVEFLRDEPGRQLFANELSEPHFDQCGRHSVRAHVAGLKSGKGFNFSIKLAPGLSGRIEVSTNLIDWNVLTNFAETNGALNISDPNATTPQRFYRAVVP